MRVINGHASKLIAADLRLSPRTVDVHRSNIMRKMGVHNAAELVRLALRARLGIDRLAFPRPGGTARENYLKAVAYPHGY